MIILNWNCRGIGHSTAISFLCDLVHIRSLDVLFLCETLSHSNKIEEIRLHLCYECTLLLIVWAGVGVCVFCESQRLFTVFLVI